MNDAFFSLSPRQRFLWQHRHAAAPRHVVHVPLPSGADAPSLVDLICARHEILRTTYPTPEGFQEPVQAVGLPVAHWLDAATTADAPWPDLPTATHALTARLVPGGVQLSLPWLSLDLDTPGLLAAELQSLATGVEPEDEPYQHPDYADWQQELYDAERDAGTEWGALHQELRPLARLFPTATAAAPAHTTRHAVPMAGITASAEQLVAAVVALVGRLCPEHAVRLGVYASGRDLDELRGALGPIGRYVPLTLEPDPAATPAQLTAATVSALADSRARQNSFFEDLGPARPFQLAVAFDTTAAWDAALPVYSPCDLVLHGCLAGDRLHLTLHHQPHSVSTTDAAAFLADLGDWLRRFCQAPDQALTLQPTLADAALARLTAAAPVPAPSADACRPLHVLLDAQAARTPDAPAVTADGVTLTFAALTADVNGLAARLHAAGIGIGHRVALCLPRTVDAMRAVFAVFKVGAAYVPFEPDDPAERVAAVLAESGVRLVLASTDTLPDAGVVPDHVPVWDLTAPAPPCTAPVPVVDEVDLPAYMITTSGSTGRPKGVLMGHRAVVNLRDTMNRLVYRHEGPYRITLNAPLSFDASMQQICMLTLGHHLCLVPRDLRFDGPGFRDFLVDHDLHMLDITPTHLQLLLEAGLPAATPNLRCASVAGGVVDEAMWARLAAGPGRWYNIYGPTEACINATGTLMTADAAPSIGTALDHYRTQILDRYLQPVAMGRPGQLAVGGVGLAFGYDRRPALTACQFVPDPFSGIPGARLYLTGDLVHYLADDRIAFLGRVDHQIKIRGYRVELGEIEKALMGHDAVDAAVVVPFAPGGRAEDLQLIAYVQAGDAAAVAAVAPWLRRLLPYYMIPAQIVPLARLPLKKNGKVDRALLPDPAELTAQAHHEPPRTPTEHKLVAIWREVLGTEVGIEDDFYALGGHSLSLMTTLTKMHEAFQGRITLNQFFEQPRIVDLAALLDQQEDAALASDEAADLLAELGDLSPEEIEALLARERAG